MDLRVTLYEPYKAGTKGGRGAGFSEQDGGFRGGASEQARGGLGETGWRGVRRGAAPPPPTRAGLGLAADLVSTTSQGTTCGGASHRTGAPQPALLGKPQGPPPSLTRLLLACISRSGSHQLILPVFSRWVCEVGDARLCFGGEKHPTETLPAQEVTSQRGG